MIALHTKKPSDIFYDENPANIKLLISGFSGQSIIAMETILSAIDKIPAYHIAGLCEIIYLPGDEKNIESAICPHAEYVQDRQQIIFYKLKSPLLFTHVLYHEIGHFVFFRILSSRIKKFWVTELYPQSASTTAYGEKNASEDFAETYACYLRDSGLLALYPAKQAFMRDLVFSGYRETLKQFES